MNSNSLAAVCVSRRLLSVAVFNGTHLEYTLARELASSITQAENTVTGMIGWLVHQFDIKTVALLQSAQESRGRHLLEIAEQTARTSALAVWKVQAADLFKAFASPPVRSKQQLREAVCAIWPILATQSTTPLIRDAVTAGLYVQVERIFAAEREAQQK